MGAPAGPGGNKLSIETVDDVANLVAALREPRRKLTAHQFAQLAAGLHFPRRLRTPQSICNPRARFAVQLVALGRRELLQINGRAVQRFHQAGPVAAGDSQQAEKKVDLFFPDRPFAQDMERRPDLALLDFTKKTSNDLDRFRAARQLLAPRGKSEQLFDLAFQFRSTAGIERHAVGVLFEQALHLSRSS